MQGELRRNQASAPSVAGGRGGRSAQDSPPIVGAVAVRLWRAAFCVAVGCVYASTHWPRLEFGVPTQPIDKFLHAGAFGILTALLWQTRWIRRRWVCMVAVAAWAAFDESTQALPGLKRSADMDDYAADCLGILMGGMFLAALRPVPGVLAAVLAERRRFLADRLFDRPSAWVHVATGAVIGMAVGCIGSIAIDSRFIAPRPYHAGIAGAIIGAIAGWLLLREFGLRSLQARMLPLRPCARCGAPEVPPDGGAAAPSSGSGGAPGECALCGAERNPLLWSPFAVASGREEVRVCAPVVAQGLGVVIVVGLLGPWLVAILDFAPLRALGARFNDTPLDLQRVFDISFVAAVGAWSLWRCRVRIARLLDRSGERCLACGYDVRAVAAKAPAGVCPECGEPFVRTASAPRGGA